MMYDLFTNARKPFRRTKKKKNNYHTKHGLRCSVCSCGCFRSACDNWLFSIVFSSFFSLLLLLLPTCTQHNKEWLVVAAVAINVANAFHYVVRLLDVDMPIGTKCHAILSHTCFCYCFLVRCMMHFPARSDYRLCQRETFRTNKMAMI